MQNSYSEIAGGWVQLAERISLGLLGSMVGLGWWWSGMKNVRAASWLRSFCSASVSLSVKWVWCQALVPYQLTVSIATAVPIQKWNSAGPECAGPFLANLVPPEVSVL